jgi:ABC-type polar amino acid transport system ATPase subunit
VSGALLDIAGLTKNYGGLRPLRVERLALGTRDAVALLGFDAPSAEMLTTLVTGAALPDTGTIHLLGRSTASIENSDDWLQLVDRIGIVTERAVLLDSLSVIQNLAIPFSLDIEPPPETVRVRAAALAAETGLPPSTWDQAVGALDGESRTRVRWARALAMDPAILLMEHPTAQVERRAVRRLAADMKASADKRGMATLTLTADDVFAASVAATVLTWDPARGTLIPRRRRWMPWQP